MLVYTHVPAQGLMLQSSETALLPGQAEPPWHFRVFQRLPPLQLWLQVDHELQLLHVAPACQDSMGKSDNDIFNFQQQVTYRYTHMQ